MGYFFEVILQPENMNRSENKIFLLRLSKIGCNNPLELNVGLLGMSQAKKWTCKILGHADFGWQDKPQCVPRVNQILGMLGTRWRGNSFYLDGEPKFALMAAQINVINIFT